MRTSFKPQTDAFAFVNDWAYDDKEKNSIRTLLSGSVAGVAALLAPIYAPIIGLAVGASVPVDALVSLLTAGLVPPGTVTAVATTASITATSTGALITLLNGWLSNFFKDDFGLCGGMAYASLDYYRLGWVVPQGSPAPDRSTPEGSALRDYIWKRLIDADLSGNVASRTIEWMALLNFIPPQFGGGPPELLKRTKAEWEILKQHLENDGPWPIAIVGTTDNPMNNHQILAYGYEDKGDGTGLVYVYDNAANPPNVENTISVDFRYDELMTNESAHKGGFDPPRGPLKGIFCSRYVPSTPPVAVGLEHGMSSSASGPVQGGTSIALTFTAKNYGYGTTSALALDSKGVSYGQPRVVYDVGEEVQRAPILAGSDRQWSGTVTVDGSGWRRYMAAAHLGVVDGVDVWKNIPTSEAGTSNFVELATYASLLTGTWLIEANGYSGSIQISSIDPAGRVTGTLFQNPMSGFWDEAARRLTMIRVIDAADPSTFQYYTGYLFPNPKTSYYSLAGTFRAYAGAGASANRDEFGWLAEQPVIS